jgi:hypothetical protein
MDYSFKFSCVLNNTQFLQNCVKRQGYLNLCSFKFYFYFLAVWLNFMVPVFTFKCQLKIKNVSMKFMMFDFFYYSHTKLNISKDFYGFLRFHQGFCHAYCGVVINLLRSDTTFFLLYIRKLESHTKSRILINICDRTECTRIVINQKRRFYDEIPTVKYIIQFLFLMVFLLGFIFLSVITRSCQTSVDLMVTRLLRICFLHWLKAKVM